VAQPGATPGDPSAGQTAAGAAAFLDEARDKLNGNDPAGALICLKTVAGLAGCPPDLLIEAAKLLVQAGDAQAAIECYLQAGTAYIRGKEFVKARQALQAGHGLDAHNLDVIFMLGQADVSEGRIQDGLAKFIDVLRKSNLKHIPALFEAGCIYQLNGQYDQAMLAFKKVLDRDKTHVQATVRIGQLFQSKEHMGDAIAYYIQAAQVARECEHWSSARQIASMVLALDAQNQKARFILDDLEEQGHGADEAEPIIPIAPPPVPAKAAADPRAKPVPQNPMAQKPPLGKAQPPPAAAVPPKAQPAPAPAPATADASRPKPAVPQQSRPASPPSAAPAPVVAQVAAKGAAVRPPQPEPEQPAAPQPAPVAATPQPEAPAAAPATDADLDRARQMLSAIEMQRQAAQADLQMLLTAREELQKALAEQRTILESAAMRKAELDAQIAASSATLEEGRAAVEADSAQGVARGEAMAGLAAERTTLETAVTQLRTDAEALAHQKAADERTIKELIGLRDATAAEVAAFTAKMQDAKRLTDELEAAHAAAAPDANAQARSRADAESAQAALTALQAKIAEASRQAAEADAIRAQRQSEADALTQRVSALTATVKDLEQRAAAPAASVAAPVSQPNVGPQGAHARAAAHLAAGEFDKAIAAYAQAFEANPHDAGAAYQAGALMAEHSADLEGAERLLQQAAELRPDHAATRYQLAVVKARRGNVVEGAELLTSLARTDANNGDFVDQFVERLEKEAQPGDLGARYRLGVAYRELGRIEEALVMLQSIQHETEFVVPCLIAIGLCLRRQGLDGAAAKRFAKAIETPGYPEPLYLEALYNLGDLYEAKGTQESLALALSSFEELYARDIAYRDIGERVRVVKTNLSSAERQKIKRLPTRLADSQGNQ
jgi:tetratricopeptide (TPR) repeat protein